MIGRIVDIGGTEIDLDLLPTLSVLLEERNVTWAAQRLGVRQSSLSSRLGRLRRAFDDPLLVPAIEGRGMVLTPRAAELQAPLAEALTALREAICLPSPFEPTLSRRTFRIALKDHAAVVLSGALAEAVMQEGGADIRLAFFPPGSATENQLQGGSVDLLIGSDEPASGLFIRRALSRRPYRTAQRLGHPRGTNPIGMDEFCALSHMVVPGKESGFECPVDAALERLGRTRRIPVSVESLAAVPTVLSRTNLVCTLPFPFLMQPEASFEYYEPPLDLGEYVLSAFWHPRNQADSGHSWLRNLLFQITSRI